MPDREKVIIEIEDALSGNLAKAGQVYKLSLNGLKDKALIDALALLKEQEHKDRMYHALEDDWKRLKELLKEQEAVAPILIREGRNNNYNDYICHRCGNEVVYEQNYCSECGVQFLWKGR